MTNQNQRMYQAYLLRIWQAPDGTCRIELQSAETLQKTRLHQLDQLVPFLKAQATDDQTKRSSA